MVGQTTPLFPFSPTLRSSPFTIAASARDRRTNPLWHASATTHLTSTADRWDEIESVFSRESVLKGSFDQYAESSKKKRGTAEVDDAFLAEIERWRDVLARNFALRNPQLSVRDLNYAVQKTIDRLIFLRICEDRGTEDYGRLNQLVNGENTWSRLREQFSKADDRYNSGLFHSPMKKAAPARRTR